MASNNHGSRLFLGWRRWIAVALAVGAGAQVAVVSTGASAVDPPPSPAAARTGKLDPAFESELTADPDGLYYDVLLTFTDPAAARAALPPGRTVRIMDKVGVARAVVSRPELLHALDSPSILAVDPNRALELLNAEARQATNVEAVHTTGSPGVGAVTGTGLHVAVIDTGLDTTHPDFAGRIEHAWVLASSHPEIYAGSSAIADGAPSSGESDKRIYVSASPSGIDVQPSWRDGLSADAPVPATADEVNHGTFVTGVLAGNDGRTDTRSLRGVAPDARIHSYRFQALASGVGAAPASFIVEAYNHIIEATSASRESGTSAW